MDQLNLIRRRFRQKSRFYTHVFIFVLINGAIWLDRFSQRLSMGTNAQAQVYAFTLLWGIVLAFHFMRWRISVAENNAMQQAIIEERAWQMSKMKNKRPGTGSETQEKPKRHVIYEDEFEVGVEVPEDEIYTEHRLSLSDDGELVEELDDSDAAATYNYQ